MANVWREFKSAGESMQFHSGKKEQKQMVLLADLSLFAGGEWPCKDGRSIFISNRPIFTRAVSDA